MKNDSRSHFFSLKTVFIAAFSLVVAGSAAFGMQTLLVAPANFCEDPILTCSLGGDALCLDCCRLSGQAGACLGNNGTVCLCFD